MTLEEVMRELESKGSESTKKTLMRHGAPEPFFGVKVGDLKPMLKKLKGQQELALELYATKNSDAMYLAGLIADGRKMTKKQLDQWATGATWHMIAGYTVPWVAAENPDAVSLAVKWTASKKDLVATAGWSTLGSVAATVPDDEIPLEIFEQQLGVVPTALKSAGNRTRYAMNNFVICVGTYVAPLADAAMKTAKKMGVVEVDMGDTDCKIPDAATYIIKSRKGSPTAPKRKDTRC